MKKVYSKPEIMFEDFTLSTSVASCEVQVESMMYECAVEFVPGVYFMFDDQVNGCNFPVEDGSEEANGICYHVPTPSNNVFGS